MKTLSIFFTFYSCTTINAASSSRKCLDSNICMIFICLHHDLLRLDPHLLPLPGAPHPKFEQAHPWSIYFLLESVHLILSHPFKLSSWRFSWFTSYKGIFSRATTHLVVEPLPQAPASGRGKGLPQNHLGQTLGRRFKNRIKWEVQKD